MSISDLLKRFLDGDEPGDPGAIGLLYQWYGRKVYRAAYYVLNDQYLAEDIVQETFLTAMSKLNALRDPAKVEAWLIRTAINKSHEAIREHRRVAALQVSATQVAATALDVDIVLDQLLDDELRKETIEALCQLPAINQEVAYYKFYRGLNCHEISEILNIPGSTVRSRLKRSLKLIAQYLHEEVYQSDAVGK